MKTALEPICMAQKPDKGRMTDNVLKWGTGAINVDGCRVKTDESTIRAFGKDKSGQAYNTYGYSKTGHKNGEGGSTKGRWPANLVLEDSEEIRAMFPVTTSGSGNKNPKVISTFNASPLHGRYDNGTFGGDTGSAARFFYQAKSSRQDRDEGLEGFEASHIRRMSGGEYADNSGSTNSSKNGAISRNFHPTVKSTDLMRWLCRLITPPGGIVLDPFMGSGSTGKACAFEGFGFIGIEQEQEYFEIAKARIVFALKKAVREQKYKNSQIDMFQNRTICNEQMEAALV